MTKNFKKTLTYLLAILLFIPAEAKDFGIQGELFAIEEENLIFVLQKQLSSNTANNPIQPLLKQIEEKAKHPKLRFIPPEATENRTYHYDPTYTVPESIKNKEGAVIVQKGTKINPLQRIQLSSNLLLFDGNNPVHIQWAHKQKEPNKWVLVNGNPFKLEEQEKRPVYFDQNGFAIDKFKLKHIPARISQEELLLKIEEVSLKEREVLPAVILSSNQELQELSKPLTKAEEDAARTFIEGLNYSPEDQQKKCSFSSSLTEFSPSAEAYNEKLLVFISFSVPLETWKEYSFFLEKFGGSFVLRGLPHNSFTSLSQKLVELRKAGVYAQILLDPPSYEKYEISKIPAILLVQGDHYDMVYGNIHLTEALRFFVESGNNKEFAKRICKSITAQP